MAAAEDAFEIPRKILECSANVVAAGAQLRLSLPHLILGGTYSCHRSTYTVKIERGSDQNYHALVNFEDLGNRFNFYPEVLMAGMLAGDVFDLDHQIMTAYYPRTVGNPNQQRVVRLALTMAFQDARDIFRASAAMSEVSVPGIKKVLQETLEAQPNEGENLEVVLRDCKSPENRMPVAPLLAHFI